MQKLIIIGNLGKDSKVVTSADNQFVSFSVAVNQRQGDQDVVTWYDCTTRRVNLAQYLKKGTQVYLEGSPRFLTYSNETGIHVQVKVYVTEIQVLTFAEATEQV